MKRILIVLFLLAPCRSVAQSCQLTIQVTAKETDHQTKTIVTELKVPERNSTKRIPVPLPDGRKELLCATTPVTFFVGSPIDQNALMFLSEVTCSYSGMQFYTNASCHIDSKEKNCIGALNLSAYDELGGDRQSYDINGEMVCRR